MDFFDERVLATLKDGKPRRFTARAFKEALIKCLKTKAHCAFGDVHLASSRAASANQLKRLMRALHISIRDWFCLVSWGKVN